MAKLTKKRHEEDLNNMEIPKEDLKSEGGHIPDNVKKYGSWLRRNDPIYFNVVYNDTVLVVTGGYTNNSIYQPKTLEGYEWKPHNRVLIEGDVIRTSVKSGDIMHGHKITPEDIRKYGPVVHAVCNGGGNGCDPDNIGNAIYVHTVTFLPQLTIAHRNDKPIPTKPCDRLFIFPTAEDFKAPRPEGFYRYCDYDRWERYWGIDVLEVKS